MERLLIVRENNFGFMRMFSDDSGVLTNRVADTSYRTLDSTINTDGNSLYIAYKSADALEVVKQSLVDFWESGDHAFSYHV